MTDWLHAAEAVVSSPWLYVILLGVSFLDSFLPAVPSEPVVVLAGVAAASGNANVLLVIAATAVGAFAGDLVPYALGRVLAAPVLRRMPVGTRRRRVHDWVSGQLATRTAFILITSRFIPVGRYFVTLSAGVSAVPLRAFAFYTAVAVITWTIFIVMTGYVGGQVLQENAFAAFVAGLVVALGVTALLQLGLRAFGGPSAAPADR